MLPETKLKLNETIDVPGYKFIGNNRRPTTDRVRIGSGGVGMLISFSFLGIFDILSIDTQYEGIISILIEHKICTFQLLIRSVYLPPSNSPYGRDPDGFFNRLLTSAYCYEPHIRLSIGDFNARIGNINDGDGVGSLSNRHVIDDITNAHGNHFIAYLADSGECVVNGRITHHLNNYTNVSVANRGGTSVVDYITCDYESLDYFEGFLVTPLLDFLDSQI